MSLLICILFTACNKEDVTEQINEHLEETVQIEQDFEGHQEKIFELEKEDAELYEEIISLGLDDLEKVQQLTDRAIDLLDERFEYVKLEKTSLEKSKTEFEKIEPLIDEINNENQKNQTKKMYDTMMKRYKAHEEVYESYSASINLTKELYKLFQQEEFKEKEVYSVITNVNDSYDNVLEA